MTSILRDRLLFITLIVVSIAWITAAEKTIPNGFSGSSLSPKTFPLVLGVLLAGLSLFGWISSELKHRREKTAETPPDRSEMALEIWAAVSTFGFLVVYFSTLYILGFLPATIITVAAFLVLVLNERSPVLVASLSAGLGFGLYLLMRVLLGVYLPPGIIGWGG